MKRSATKEESKKDRSCFLCTPTILSGSKRPNGFLRALELRMWLRRASPKATLQTPSDQVVGNQPQTWLGQCENLSAGPRIYRAVKLAPSFSHNRVSGESFALLG